MRTEEESPEAIEGGEFNLLCKVNETGYPKDISQYFWYKYPPGELLQDSMKYSGATTSTLTIKNLRYKDDDSSYECKLLTDAGMSTTDQKYNLSVLRKYTPLHYSPYVSGRGVGGRGGVQLLANHVFSSMFVEHI